MPPLDFTTGRVQPEYHNLQPRYTIHKPIKREPDEGEQHPGAALHANINMDLDYLDDLEPLPMLQQQRAMRNNSLNLMGGLQSDFPTLFYPSSEQPELFQSESRRNSNSGRPTSNNSEESDPFYQPWHMSI